VQELQSYQFHHLAAARNSTLVRVSLTPEPQVPKIPLPPPKPLNPFSQPSFLQELKASKVGILDPTTGARYANRTNLNQNAYDHYWGQAMSELPEKDNSVNGTQAEVSRIVRCVVNSVKSKIISNLWLDMLYRNRRYYLPTKQNVDLSLPLGEMAAGKCRPFEHGKPRLPRDRWSSGGKQDYDRADSRMMRARAIAVVLRRRKAELAPVVVA
jgi:hypothetical protein